MNKEIALKDITDNPFQSRKDFDADQIRSLRDEIKAEGFWNTTLQARRGKNGKVELVFGHRRLRALRMIPGIDTIKVEIVDLTDAQMAMRCLEENLQREGLGDLDKADAVRRAVELLGDEYEAGGRKRHGAAQHVADRLGLDKGWVSQLCEISLSLDNNLRAPVEAGDIVAKTALAAKRWGGDEYVKTLAKQGAAHKKDSSVPKPNIHTVTAMRKAVAKAPEMVREKLKEAVVSGQLTTPAQVEKKARSLALSHIKRTKEAPPDLREVILNWAYQLDDWTKQLKEVQPYMDYVEEVPAIAEKFRKAAKAHIEALKALM